VDNVDDDEMIKIVMIMWMIIMILMIMWMLSIIIDDEAFLHVICNISDQSTETAGICVFVFT